MQVRSPNDIRHLNLLLLWNAFKVCLLGQRADCTRHGRGSLATTQLACDTRHGMVECADSCPLIDPCRQCIMMVQAV